MDIHPTLAKLAGTSVPKDRTIDGHVNTGVLLGHPGARSPYKHFFYQQGGKLAAVRAGDWKLFRNGELYNLRSDLGETNNVAANHADIVQQLQQLFIEFANDIQDNSRPVGIFENSRTLTPRRGIDGEDAFIPTLKLPLRN